MFALLTGNIHIVLLCFLLIAVAIAYGYLLYLYFTTKEQPALEWSKLDNVGSEE